VVLSESLKGEHHRGHLEEFLRIVKMRDRKWRDLKGWAEGVAGIPSWTMLQVCKKEKSAGDVWW
jgi:hypothetical protein